MKLDIIKRHGRAAVGRQEVESMEVKKKYIQGKRMSIKYFTTYLVDYFFSIKRNVVFGLRQRMGGDFLSGELRCREYLLIMF